MAKYSPVVENYFQRVIKNSWTWARLTPEERQRFIDLNFDVIKGNDQTRVEWLMSMYNAFLTALDYNWHNWREPEGSEPIPF